MQITPTQLTYYLICKSKLWLFSNGINMEQTSEIVAEGKLISETTYTNRASKYTELDLGIAKIDYYDAKNKVIHEVKKSNKLEQAHIWQVKYYIYILNNMGIEGVTGIIEYPKLKQKVEVFLTEPDIDFLINATVDIEQIINSDKCPQAIKKPYCRSCSYFELCWVQE